jgi:diaminopimelate decarboxylase
MASGDAHAFSTGNVARQFSVIDSDLVVGGVPARSAAETFGTPLYLYDGGCDRRTFRALKQALTGFAEVFYSIKANPNPAIAARLITAGAGVEVASAGEFRIAMRAGDALAHHCRQSRQDPLRDRHLPRARHRRDPRPVLR